MLRSGEISPHLVPTRGVLVAAGVVTAFAAALAGVVRFGLPVWSLAVVTVIAAYVAVVLQKPTVGLLAVVGVFFIPLKLTESVSLLHIVGGATAALLLIAFLYQRRSLYVGGIMVPLFLIGMLILVSTEFTLDPESTTFYFKRWIFNFAFVMMMMNLVTGFETFKKLVWTVILMAALNAGYGIFDYATSTDIQYRSQGLLENANDFGHLAVLAFPLALYQYLYRRGALRWIGLALAVVLAGGVVVSVSRGAVVSLLTVAAVMLLVERQRLVPMLLVIGLAVATVPFLPAYFHERLGNLAEDVKNSVGVFDERGPTSRGYLNSAGMKIWLAHPVLGVGIGNFQHYFHEREFEPGAPQAEIAHNIYVQALCETGTVGAAVLAWLIALTWRDVLRARRASRDDHERWIYFGAVEMMALAILVSTASSGSLMSNDFWMYIGLTAVSSRVATTERPAAELLADGAAA